MIKTRRRTKAFKMALAGMFTTLVLENIIQTGLFVPAYAEDSDENYTDSQEWQEFKSYWVTKTDEQITNFVATQSPDLQAQYLTYILAGNMAIANMEYQQNALALRADPNTGAIDYSVDIPTGSIETGWYYRGGKPHSVTCFFYGSNGDAVIAKGSHVIFASSDDFTIAVDFTPAANIAYPAFSCVDRYGYYYAATQTSSNARTLTFTGTSCTGLMTDFDFTDSSLVYLSRIATYDYIVTFDEVSLSSSKFVSPASRPDYFIGGNLKDSNNRPISNSRQAFVRASVGNNFPAFLTDLKQQLDDNFPEEVVNELWYDPTQGEPLPDVGTLDSLIFPSGLPSSSFNDVQLPSEPLPQKMISGATFWFTSFSNMLDAFGVKYIVITFLIIALIMAILKI